jgi:hypothetical protein
VEVAVVGRDQRDPGGPRQFRHAGPDQRLLDHAVILDLEEEVVGAEDRAVLLNGSPRRRRIAGQQMPGRLAGETGGEADQALAVLGQKRLRDPQLVVERPGSRC